jgi:ActR/RegA family two-component response regulator
MLCSLLISADDNAARVIGRIFKDLGVECEHCAESKNALQLIAKRRFDAVVIDDSVEQAASILEKLIEAPGYSKSVRILLVDGQGTTSTAFKANTQVVLYKPLSAERVRHGLRAVRNLMARDRRRGSARVATMLSARVRHGRSSGMQAFISDLSDSGAALQCGDREVPSGNLHIDFALPNDPDRIYVVAELVWQDSEGTAGVRFMDMAMSARKRLAHWLKEEAAKGTPERLALAKSLGL